MDVASITDAAVGALCARSAVIGAFLNVKINTGSYDDKNYVNEILAAGQKIVDSAVKQEQDLMVIVNGKIWAKFLLKSWKVARFESYKVFR